MLIPSISTSHLDFTGATFADSPKPRTSPDFTGAKFSDTEQPIDARAPEPQAAPAQASQISAPNTQPDFAGATFAQDEAAPAKQGSPPEVTKSPPPILPPGAIPSMPKSPQGAENSAHLRKITGDADIETT